MFDWDEDNLRQIAEHDVTLEGAEQVLLNDPVDGGVQEHNGELRYVEIGFTDALRMLVVITTDRRDVTRVATAFPVTPHYATSISRRKGYRYER